MTDKNNRGGKRAVDIPDGALMACPLIEDGLRKMIDCTVCESFRGLVKRDVRSVGNVSFERQYMVLCAAELSRPIIMLREGK